MTSCDEACQGAESTELVLLLTNWNEIRAVKFIRLVAGPRRVCAADLLAPYCAGALRDASLEAVVCTGRTALYFATTKGIAAQ